MKTMPPLTRKGFIGEGRYLELSFRTPCSGETEFSSGVSDRCRITAFAEMTASSLIREWSSSVRHGFFTVSRKLNKVVLKHNKRI